MGGDGFVLKLQEALNDAGYDAFIGEQNLEGGQDWANELMTAIRSCELFVPICSPGYGESKWTSREMAMADANVKKIVPVWHSGDKFPPTKVEIYLLGSNRVPRGNTRGKDVAFADIMNQLLDAIQLLDVQPRRVREDTKAELERKNQESEKWHEYVDTDGDVCTFCVAGNQLHSFLNGKYEQRVDELGINFRTCKVKDKGGWSTLKPEEFLKTTEGIRNLIKHTNNVQYYEFVDYTDTDGDYGEWRLYNNGDLAQYVNYKCDVKKVLTVGFCDKDCAVSDDNGFSHIQKDLYRQVKPHIISFAERAGCKINLSEDMMGLWAD